MKRPLLTQILALSIAALMVVWTLYPVGTDAYESFQVQRQRQEYRDFINNHPYNLTAEEASAIPKSKNPGERWMQDFLLTMDPKTRTVPRERLFEANRITNALKASPPTRGPNATTSSWSERGPNNVGGRTRAIMFDPNDGNNKKVWAGGVSGGLWFTNDITNAATSWNSVNDFWANLAVQVLAYDPTNTQVFYAGMGEGWFNGDAVQGGGIFKSINGGTSWTQLASTIPPADGTFDNVQDVVVTANGTVLAATREGSGVQRSTNGGLTWTPVLNSATNPAAGTSRAADLEIASDGTIYATMGIFSNGGIFTSTSASDGAVWTGPLNTGANGMPANNNLHRIDLAVAPSRPTTLYAQAQVGGFGPAIDGVYHSGNGGATWQQLPSPVDCDGATIPAGDYSRGQAWYDNSITVNPTDSSEIYIGAIDNFRSSNAHMGSAATWGQISIWLAPASLGCALPIPVVHADQHTIVFRPGSSTEAVLGHDGGIEYTADITAGNLSTTFPSYVNRDKDYNVTQFYSTSQNPANGSNLFVGGTQDNGSPQLNGAGISGQLLDATGGDGGFAHINQTVPGAGNVSRLGIGANTGTFTHCSIDGGSTYSFLTSVGGCAASFINPTDLNESTNELYMNCGAAFMAQLSGLVAACGGGGGLGVVASGPGGGFLSSATHIRTSELAPAATATVFVGTAGGDLFKGTDLQVGGVPAWVQLTDPGVAGSISSIDIGATENDLLVTYTNFGVASVHVTSNGGTSWTDLDTGSNLPDMPVRWGMFDPADLTRAIIATETGIWESEDITAGPLSKTLVVTWAPSPDIPTVRVDMLKYRAADGSIIAGTHGRGFWSSTFTPLPVELVAFEVTLEDMKAVLSWKTASEQNNAGFEIQKRIDDDVEWSFEGFVEGRGTTEEPGSYSFRTDDLTPGTYVFRLKQVDFDGAFEYSDEVEAVVGVPGKYVLTSAYPNPFNPSTQFELAVARDQRVLVEVVNELGQRVEVLYDGVLAEGKTHRFVFEAPNLPSGVYFYRAVGESFATDAKSVTLLK